MILFYSCYKLSSGKFPCPNFELFIAPKKFHMNFSPAALKLPLLSSLQVYLVFVVVVANLNPLVHCYKENMVKRLLGGRRSVVSFLRRRKMGIWRKCSVGVWVEERSQRLLWPLGKPHSLDCPEALQSFKFPEISWGSKICTFRLPPEPPLKEVQSLSWYCVVSASVTHRYQKHRDLKFYKWFEQRKTNKDMRNSKGPITEPCRTPEITRAAHQSRYTRYSFALAVFWMLRSCLYSANR